jgi:ubiquinone/menaquinone biosynthesis C-methylase UbiE
VLRALLARIAAIPPVYDLIQAAAGEAIVQQKLASCLRVLPAGSRLIELGGGTGLSARSTRQDSIYVCLDLDVGKLQRFVQQHRGARAVAGDATRCPIGTGVADAVMAIKVVHHLDDSQLAAMVDEAARMMRCGGTLIVVDPVLMHRLGSRLLWRYDRGAYPRSAARIQTALRRRFTPLKVEEFSVTFRHQFLLFVGSRADADANATAESSG